MAGITAVGVMAATSVVSAYSGIKGAESAEQGLRAQKGALEDQQKAQANELSKAQAAEDKKKKASSDTLRKQLVGESGYSINQTGATGLEDPGQTLTGGALG